MICAKQTDALRYKGIHPNLDLALEKLTPEFLASLGKERVELKGSEVYCTKSSLTTVPDQDTFFEAHRDYLDIHVVLEGAERVGISSPAELTEYEAHPESDYWLYHGPCRQQVVLTPGEFLVVFPDDAHRLKMQAEGPQNVTKVVFKVKLS
jgi:YhcH/YjgK/YiaL family protein